MWRRPEAGRWAAALMFLSSCWRARWRSLVVVALMVALTGGFASAALAGARRTASSPARFDRAAWSRDLMVTDDEDQERRLERLLGGPLVEAHLDLVWVFAYVGGRDSFVFAPTGPAGLDVERGVVVEGRRADPGDPHELVLSEVTARQYGLGVGDTAELATLSPEQVSAMFEGQQEPTSFDGPVVEMRVVGVVRTLSDLSARPDEPIPVVLTPAFLDRYRGLVGMGGPSHMVRLADTPDAADRFGAAVDRAFAGEPRPGRDTSARASALDDSVGVITIALVVLALVVAVPGLVWAAAAIARQQRLSAGDLDVLRTLGAARAERRLLAVGTAAPALLAGAAFAPAVAVALSPVFPVGLARRLDPDTGPHADVTILAATAVVVLIVLGVAAALSAARLVDRAGRHEASPVPAPAAVGWATRSLGPAPAAGVRFALWAPRAVSVPVRPALVGACVGVVGLVGVVVVGASLDRFVVTPARWGTTWDAAVADGPSDQVDRDQVVDRALRDRDIEAAAMARFDEQATIDGREAKAMTLEPVKGDLTPTIVDGREPRSADEVAVGPDTLARLGASVGQHVAISSRSWGREDFRIVGVALFPTIDYTFPLADGAAFTTGGGDRLHFGDPHRADAGFERLLVRWAPGVDHDAAVRDLRRGGATVDLPTASSEVTGLRDVRLFPAAAAAGLVVLGVTSTSHALAVTVRRRRVELGVLSALGFTPGQRRVVIVAQATTIGCVALVVGIPLGAVAGRLVWSTIAGSLGVATDAVLPAGLLAVGALAVILVLNLIAAVPARSAGRLPVAEALRSE
jgi:hypothetical protein